MAVVSGTFLTATVGRIHGTALVRDGGTVGVFSFVAESHATEINPCFEVVSPSVSGWPVRLSAWPVAGSAGPSIDFTLTMEDQFGSSWSVTIDKDGDDNFLSNPYPPVQAGTLKISATNFGGASLRMRITMIFADTEPGHNFAAATFDSLSPLTTRGDMIRRGASTAERFAVGSSGQILQSNGTDPGWATTLGIANGGTGQTGQTAAFDALAPTTTAGDSIYYNGSDNVRLAIGTSGQRLRTNSGATAPSWATDKEDVLIRDGLIASTFDRAFVGTTALGVTSGTLYLYRVGLKQGQTVTNLIVCTGSTAATLPTNWWFVLYDASLNLISQTADQTTTAVAANTVYTLALGSAYTPTSDVAVYFGAMFAATTPPTVLRGIVASGSATLGAMAPVLSGTSSTGLTTTAPNPAAAITATSGGGLWIGAS